jgi:hypothetical protein
MKYLIYKYLDRNFIIKEGKVYDTNDYVYYGPRGVIDILNKVFNLTKKQLKPYIRDWIRTKDRSFDFKLFWTYVEYVFPPIVALVFSRTISADLVRVEPMEQPRAQLFYLDYTYERPVIEYTERHNRNYNLLHRQMMSHYNGMTLFGNVN